MDVGLVMALVAMLATLGAALVAAWAGRRKIDAEGTALITEAALSLIEPLRERVAHLEETVELIRDERDHWLRVAQHGHAVYVDRYQEDPEWWVPFRIGR